MGRLEGKVAIITGGARGMGEATCRRFVAEGAKVAIADVLDERGQALAAELGPAARFWHLDVTSEDGWAKVVADVEAAFGGIDVLVNNAGIQRRGPLEDYPEETWHELMRTNLDSVFYVAQAVARGMIARKRGKIINICSVQSELGRPGIAPYAASKGAVKMLTKGMCADWAKHGVQVNGIGPGYFETELTAALVADPAFSDWLCKRTPAGRWGRVEELAGAAIFLASGASDFVNGQILYVDGGLTSVV